MPTTSPLEPFIGTILISNSPFPLILFINATEVFSMPSLSVICAGHVSHISSLLLKALWQVMPILDSCLEPINSFILSLAQMILMFLSAMLIPSSKEFNNFLTWKLNSSLFSNKEIIGLLVSNQTLVLPYCLYCIKPFVFKISRYFIKVCLSIFNCLANSTVDIPVSEFLIVSIIKLLSTFFVFINILEKR